MIIKDLPVGTKYRMKDVKAYKIDTEVVYIIPDLEYIRSNSSFFDYENGASYCITNNEIIPWNGHEDHECEIVE